MIVMKFGGTSVATMANIDGVLSIAEASLGDAPVLVSSAMGKTTDRLVEVTALSATGHLDEALRTIDEMERRHLEAISGIDASHVRDECTRDVSALFSELRSLATGIALIQECSPRTHDAILSFGERLSTRIIAARAQERGLTVSLLDSRDFVITDEEFGSASVDLPATYARIVQAVHPKSGQLIVVQGFIGRSTTGVTSTLGRGGSDYSASIIGAALSAARIEIWTDVDGIMTTDPRLVPEARTIDRMSYDEAAELAYFGARVVHPSTIQPAVDLNIPVLVRNTARPDGTGTRISADPGESGVRALATKSEISVITVHSSRMLNAYGFLARIFDVFEHHRVSVDLVTTSEVSVSMSIDGDAAADFPALVAELETLGRVGTEGDQAIISLVGHNLWKDSTTVARVFDVLSGVPIRLISLGSSDVNLTIVVPDGEVEGSVSRLHSEFFVR